MKQTKLAIVNYYTQKLATFKTSNLEDCGSITFMRESLLDRLTVIACFISWDHSAGGGCLRIHLLCFAGDLPILSYVCSPVGLDVPSWNCTTNSGQGLSRFIVLHNTAQTMLCCYSKTLHFVGCWLRWYSVFTNDAWAAIYTLIDSTGVCSIYGSLS